MLYKGQIVQRSDGSFFVVIKYNEFVVKSGTMFTLENAMTWVDDEISRLTVDRGIWD